MFEVVKIGGIWQIWNVTCDGSIIVENGHRNMGFFQRRANEKVETLTSALRAIKPVFSLSMDFSKITLESSLEQDPGGFHVFDYAQLQESGIDINIYVQVIDSRLGSFIVFRGNVFTAERIADELDTYPGRPFLTRHLGDQEPVPIEAKETLDIIVPSREDVKTKLLEEARESRYGDYEEYDQHKLEEEIEDYIETYCYPDLDLNILASCPGK